MANCVHDLFVLGKARPAFQGTDRLFLRHTCAELYGCIQQDAVDDGSVREITSAGTAGVTI